MPSTASSAPVSTVERWRCPTALRLKWAAIVAVAVPLTLVFFPLWFALPVAAACTAWGLGIAMAGGLVAVDQASGLLVLRMGLIVRRIRLTDVRAVLVEQAKVSVARGCGDEISLYAWRKGAADRLLGVPVVASEVGHAISRAVALAQAAAESEAPAGQAAPAGARGRRPAGRSSASTRSRLATVLLGGAGLIAIVGALVIRIHWHNPVLTWVSVILALMLGVCGMAYVLVAIWILLTGRPPGIFFPQ